MTTTPASDPGAARSVLFRMERVVLATDVPLEAWRAHQKHEDRSMAIPYLYTEGERLAHLVEEVGEVSRCLSEHAQGRPLDRPHLRQELVEVAHLAALWVALVDLEDV